MVYTTALFRLLAAVVVLTLVDGSCPDYWTSYAASCYTLIKNPSTWAGADDICKDFDAFLVEVDTNAENEFLISFLKNKKLSTRAVWLGGNDLLSESHWMWSHSQEPVIFTDWAPTQPDNVANTENCLELAIESRFGFKWNDNVCSARQYFICEQPDSSNAIIG
ncbi:echinoidin-like [Haliotis rufescens]|uniref:echinoidin-like n=1 Tax=Haliotis rufescens TaxID=6454 RepID=UPI00201F9A8B|nr:echinoidin-like [Haliotis rufescens]